MTAVTRIARNASLLLAGCRFSLILVSGGAQFINTSARWAALFLGSHDFIYQFLDLGPQLHQGCPSGISDPVVLAHLAIHRLSLTCQQASRLQGVQNRVQRARAQGVAMSR